MKYLLSILMVATAAPALAGNEEWAVPNSEFYLTTMRAGENAMVHDANGTEVKFEVLSEYSSASKKFCKKYAVAGSVNLACFNPHWKPVRMFE